MPAKTLRLLAALGAVSCAAAPGSAQVVDATDRVYIVGSRLPLMADDGPAPVQVISRAEIEQSGYATVAELVKGIVAGNSGGADESTVLSFAPGVTSLSLRGLGTHATLVLIDGRRVAPAGFSPNAQTSAVSVSALPLDMIERVEILLDGASALYGSDAVGGVVNFVTRKRLAGVVARASVGLASPRGDARSSRASITVGVGQDEGPGPSGVLGIEHHQQQALKASARPRTATGDFSAITGNDWRSTYAYPGNLYTAGGSDGGGQALIQALTGCAGTADTAGACVYDPVRHQDLVPRIERDAAFANLSWRLDGRTELFSTVSVARTRFLQEDPTVSSEFYYQFFGMTPGAAITLPVGHPQNPTTAPVALRTRWADRPLEVSTTVAEQRLVAGLRTDVRGWSTEIAALHSRSATRLTHSGVIRDAVMLTEVLDPANGMAARVGYRFGDPTANPSDLMARLYPTLHSSGTSSLDGIDVRASRDLMPIGGGVLAIAAGAEWRRERLHSVPDPLLAAGEISVVGAYGAAGARDVAAAFAEVSAPLATGLDLRGAVRADRYDGFGLATSPKLSLRWQAAPGVALRASVSRGFRAPSIGELTQAPTRAFYAGIRDPLLCPDPSDTANAECSRFVLATLAAGAGLHPERSTSRNVGVVLTPSRESTLSIDAYAVRRTNEIALYDPTYVLANEGRLGGLVHRDPTTGSIVSMDLPLTNVGRTTVWGLDLAGQSRWAFGDAGALSLGITYNYQPSYRVTPIPGAPSEQRAGAYLQPRHRGGVSVNWALGSLSLRSALNRVGSYSRSYGPSDAACEFSGTPLASLCRIGSWTTLDIGAAWRPTATMELSLNVRNALNTAPPVDERFDRLIYTLYSPSYHGAIGRHVSLGARLSF